MGNAIWLLLALPQWYFATIVSPMSAGILSAIPAMGIIALFVGVSMAAYRRDWRPSLFLISALLSEALVSIAGLCRGQFPEASSAPIVLGFGVVQLLLCGYLIFRLKGVRYAAICLAIFSISYALLAMFIAAMSFADDWI